MVGGKLSSTICSLSYVDGNPYGATDLLLLIAMEAVCDHCF
jgi:hypothetical protein